MVFSSITFLFYYLPCSIGLYFCTKFRNIALLILSLLFYAWGESEYVLILLCMCLVNYFFGLMIFRNTTKSLVPIILGISVNLCFLIFFKYTNFIVDTLNTIISPFNINKITISDIHLPLGISFFTFQAMSYLIDVYRNKAPAEKNPINVILYISLFPQLIAGPIVRFHSIVKELHTRKESIELFSVGVKFFVIGLGQKVLIANTLALPADKIFALSPDMLNMQICWLAAVCYTLQIYFDFLGYSNMAIGLGLFFGFHFPKNFDYPYQSKSITEFWKRWHITLSSWLRDYLYIPLGGNRKGPTRTYINLLIVFFICGLWHGASWTFVIWGLYHGAFMIIERVGFSKVIAKAAVPLRHLYLIFVVIIGWIIFRSDTFSYALAFIKNLFVTTAEYNFAHPIEEYLHPDVLIALFFGVICSFPIYDIIKQKLNNFSIANSGGYRLAGKLFNEVTVIISLVTLMLMSAIQLASGTYNPFIYFRF